ncbi:hypothetical protein RIF29_39656 [Crotalaria pallida]|uniref:Uncharacterized protein n=1 Tax=Crotalaria pallida TaxID=3830 RepID=A0AAN9HPT4_CROPI
MCWKLFCRDLVHFLAAESIVVHSYATICIEKLLLAKDEGARATYTSAYITPTFTMLLNNLFTALKLQEVLEASDMSIDEYGHQVRLATHANFNTFVKSNGVDVYLLGGHKRAQAIIANHPASGHMHVAEALGWQKFLTMFSFWRNAHMIGCFLNVLQW